MNYTKKHSETFKKSQVYKHISPVSIIHVQPTTNLRQKLQTWVMNFSLRGHLDPNDFACNVMFSFVWESNDGFSM